MPVSSSARPAPSPSREAAGPGRADPPLLTGGSQVPRFALSCHAFAAVFPSGETVAVVERLEELARTSAVELRSPNKRYAGALRIGQAFVNWSGEIDAYGDPQYTTTESFLDIRGGQFEEWDWEDVANLWFFLAGIGAQCTQIHLALDDHSKSFKFGSILRADEAGQCRPFKKGFPGGDKRRGRSHTFGNKGKSGSGVQVQFYEKDKQSGGAIDAHRLEARWWKQRDRAHQVWRYVYPWDDVAGVYGCSQEEFARSATECVVGSIDLPCPFYKRLRRGVARVRLAKRIEREPDHVKMWRVAERSSGTSWSALLRWYEAQGRRDEFVARFLSMCRDHEPQFRQHHRRMIETAPPPESKRVPEAELPF